MNFTIPGETYNLLNIARGKNGAIHIGTDQAITALGTTTELVVFNAADPQRDTMLTTLPTTLPYLNKHEVRIKSTHNKLVLIEVNNHTAAAMGEATEPLNYARQATAWVLTPPRHITRLNWAVIGRISNIFSRTNQSLTLSAARNTVTHQHGWIWAGTLHGYNVQFVAKELEL